VRIPLVIWGTGGHARVVADVVRCGSAFEIQGFLDNVNPGRHGEVFCKAPVLGGGDQLAELKQAGVRHFLVALGDNCTRGQLGRDLVAAGFDLAQAIHPRSIVAADVSIGAGTVVMAGAVVNSGARIGMNVIVNTAATVDHDCALGDTVHVSPGAHLAGGVSIGQEAWIGLGALVLEGRSVGARTIVGAGSVVTRDLPDGVVAYGVPAKFVRAR
jgi:UDP-N-acetylbacillosamine N-acetyltransferase